MNYVTTVFLVSFLSTISAYSSSSSRTELPLEHWVAMSSLTIKYNQAVKDFQEGKAVDFQPIFEGMESLAQALPEENDACKNYQNLIQERKKQVANSREVQS